MSHASSHPSAVPLFPPVVAPGCFTTWAMVWGEIMWGGPGSKSQFCSSPLILRFTYVAWLTDDTVCGPGCISVPGSSIAPGVMSGSVLRWLTLLHTQLITVWSHSTAAACGGQQSNNKTRDDICITCRDGIICYCRSKKRFICATLIHATITVNTPKLVMIVLIARLSKT